LPHLTADKHMNSPSLMSSEKDDTARPVPESLETRSNTTSVISDIHLVAEKVAVAADAEQVQPQALLAADA
jgi:hypothetical protein